MEKCEYMYMWYVPVPSLLYLEHLLNSLPRAPTTQVPRLPPACTFGAPKALYLSRTTTITIPTRLTPLNHPNMPPIPPRPLPHHPTPSPPRGNTLPPVVICLDSDDNGDNSRQGSSAFLTTYPPDLGSSYLTTPPPDLGFTGTASTTHPLVDVQEQQPHPTLGMVVILMTQSGYPLSGSVTRTPCPLTAPANC